MHGHFAPQQGTVVLLRCQGADCLRGLYLPVFVVLGSQMLVCVQVVAKTSQPSNAHLRQRVYSPVRIPLV
jgi:hypothetical protein